MRDTYVYKMCVNNLTPTYYIIMKVLYNFLILCRLIKYKLYLVKVNFGVAIL
jgi:hypothetical protein